MSDTESSLVENLDTDRLAGSLDYEELFEGTALEGVEEEEGGIAEAIGRRLGGAIGRWIGEVVGARLGAVVLPALLGAGETREGEGETEADGREEASEADEEEQAENASGESEGSDDQEADGNE